MDNKQSPSALRIHIKQQLDIDSTLDIVDIIEDFCIDYDLNIEDACHISLDSLETLLECREIATQRRLSKLSED